jgi:hypothetical protein
MSPGIQQTRAAPEEIQLPPLEWKVNWWGILGFLCVVASAFLSVGILYEVVDFLKSNGIFEFMPVLG